MHSRPPTGTRSGRVFNPAALVCLCLLLAPWVSAAQVSESRDAWAWLQEVRDSLTKAPLTASFIQVFRPAGFSGEEREDGDLYLELPDCVRWDYREPFPKSFLLCNEVVYMWNEGESSGRMHTIRVAEQPGLDLMTLQVDLLRERYEAVLTSADDDRVALDLTPLAPDSELRSASVILDPAARRPRSIEYTDRQGNLTRFELTDYAPLDDSDRFQPPNDLEWLER